MASTPASMLRIVGYGLQDLERLNPPRGQPSTKFYTAVLRPRSRWASQWRRVEFDNLADFGRRATTTLPILGEFITRATLVVELPDIYAPQAAAEAAVSSPSVLIGPYWSWTNGLGHAICSNVEFSIGSQVIDRFDSRLLEVIDEQNAPVEHWDSTNAMIGRDPSAYTQFAARGLRPTQTRPLTLEVVFPFWWNRGPGPQALPIQALAKEKVQITVDFRTIQECVYTDGRVNPLNPGLEATQAGPMPLIAGCGFYTTNEATGVPIYDMTRVGVGTPLTTTPLGEVLAGYTMPREFHFQDAYWIVEYVSLEDREAAAFRMADLQIPIEQHVAVPVYPTNGLRELRIPLGQGGLVRDMTWVAQREEATDYNAYFLYSRDLGPPDASGSFIPWWPDTRVPPDWDFGDGYVRPAFADRQSEPIREATLWLAGRRRFEHDGPSLFRSLIPALGSARTPLIDRYIYKYDFGFWPTGGLSEALYKARDEVRGFANWDKIQPKEFALSMNVEACQRSWVSTDSTPYVYDSSGLYYLMDLSGSTEGIRVELQGGRKGALVRGVVDYQQILRTFGSMARLVIRIVPAGSASLLVRKPVGASYEYTWIAVAGGGGEPDPALVGGGGPAASAVAVGFRGDGVQTHDATPAFGGAGGGRGSAAGVGAPDGTTMSTDSAFVLSLTSTGGTTGLYEGGDGYTGGGSGATCGGGGGSYVSRFITEVETYAGGDLAYPYAQIQTLGSVEQERSKFNIYIWLTTYNLLRITGGRAALMFSA
jgi:hypothetical protein